MNRAFEMVRATILERPNEYQVLKFQSEDEAVENRAVAMVSSVFFLMFLCFLYGRLG